jgi:transketolase
MVKVKSMRAGRTGFGEGLLEAGRRDSRVVALGSDLTVSTGMHLFLKEFPERFFSFGIAEQNAIGVASGMALSGRIPFMSSYAVFSALRTTDQIRVSVCYNNLPVKIGGAHAGLSVGPDGATHQALEDLAVMRVLPGMTVLSPCDATQTKLAVLAAVEQVEGPVYIRYGREAMPDFTNEDLDFIVGKAQIMNPGRDATIIATGHLVYEALRAAEKLKKTGVSVRVVNIHTVKPIDVECIVTAARETGAIVTAEEHQISGGLGGAVAEVLGREMPVPIEQIGMNDQFGESGKPMELLEKYHMTHPYIIQAVEKVINRKAL